MSSTLLFLSVSTAALWISQSLAMNDHPNIFAPQSNATCLSDYAWMNNAERYSPCLTVAYVIAACVGDTWIQPALPPGSHYDSPNGSTATPCYCSWSCYNLMMGCTLCQNQSFTNEMTTWPAFSQNCLSNFIDEIFPQSFVIANNVSIPYWATIDPKTWSNELFDINQAQTLASQNHSDYYPSGSGSGSSSSPSSGVSSSGQSTNIGAIIGGTVGGAAFLLFVFIGGFFLYKRRQHRRVHNLTAGQKSNAANNTHTRWPSDSTMPFSPALLGSPQPMSYTAVRPFPPEMAITRSTYPSLQAMSPAPTDAGSFYTTANTAPHQRNPSIPMV